MPLLESLNDILSVIFILTARHIANYHGKGVLPLVHVIDADFWFNFATDYLEAHLRRLEIVDMPIEQLEFDGIFDVEKAEDYCDGVGLGKAL